MINMYKISTALNKSGIIKDGFQYNVKVNGVPLQHIFNKALDVSALERVLNLIIYNEIFIVDAINRMNKIEK